LDSGFCRTKKAPHQFNDPVPVPNPGEKAIRIALAMRDKMGDLTVLCEAHGIGRKEFKRKRYLD
jgi:hypothetical protein